MIILKSPRQVERMRQAGRVIAEAHGVACRMVVPGTPTREIDEAVARLLTERGAAAVFREAGREPFPAATSIAVNEQIAHAVPGRRRLEEGDLVTIDVGIRLNGWCADAARTYAVGLLNPESSRLLRTGQRALETAVSRLQRWSHWSEVAHAVTEQVEAADFQLCGRMVGHGIGREMHEDPQVQCRFGPDVLEHDFPLEPGLVLAVEPVVVAGSPDIRTDNEGTVITADGAPAVHFEQTVAVTPDGARVLTADAD